MKSLALEKFSSLSLLLYYLLTYYAIKVIAFYINKDRFWTIYSSIGFIVIAVGLFSISFLIWRIALIYVAAGFSLCSILSIPESFYWAEFLTNLFLAVTLFLMSVLIDDPRAIRKLKSAVQDLDI